MPRDFCQSVWNQALERDWLEILERAIREDLGTRGDCTTLALIPEGTKGRAAVVVRRAGVLAGEAAVAPTLARFDPALCWTADAHDGQTLKPKQSVGRIEGPARSILAAERPLLNLLGRLSGIATLTRKYVDLTAGSRAGIYDTRKTTPGWRTLEKYAVRCGGGRNHRGGLDEAVLIKDNHLALGAELLPRAAGGFSPADAVRKARKFCADQYGEAGRRMIVEIEIDSLDQLDGVLDAGPDIVLLDNMSPEMLREAVARRDALAPAVELEASGGIDLQTVRAVAASGVERISVGGLTHSAIALDFGLDWSSQ